MKLVNYDKQVYGELSAPKQILLYLINLSGRLWHGKQDWKEMNGRWEKRRKATDITRLGNVVFYEDHRK